MTEHELRRALEREFVRCYIMLAFLKSNKNVAYHDLRYALNSLWMKATFILPPNEELWRSVRELTSSIVEPQRSKTND